MHIHISTRETIKKTNERRTTCLEGFTGDDGGDLQKYARNDKMSGRMAKKLHYILAATHLEGALTRLLFCACLGDCD